MGSTTYTLSVKKKHVRVRQWLDSLESQGRSEAVCNALETYLDYLDNKPIADMSTLLTEVRSLKDMVRGARLFVEGSPRPAPEPEAEREAIPGLDAALKEFGA